jgi:hypothetical protein
VKTKQQMYFCKSYTRTWRSCRKHTLRNFSVFPSKQGQPLGPTRVRQGWALLINFWNHGPLLKEWLAQVQADSQWSVL